MLLLYGDEAKGPLPTVATSPQRTLAAGSRRLLYDRPFTSRRAAMLLASITAQSERERVVKVVGAPGEAGPAPDHPASLSFAMDLTTIWPVHTETGRCAAAGSVISACSSGEPFLVMLIISPW
jgi:hypothetical protein